MLITPASNSICGRWPLLVTQAFWIWDLNATKPCMSHLWRLYNTPTAFKFGDSNRRTNVKESRCGKIYYQTWTKTRRKKKQHYLRSLKNVLFISLKKAHNYTTSDGFIYRASKFLYQDDAEIPSCIYTRGRLAATSTSEQLELECYFSAFILFM